MNRRIFCTLVILCCWGCQPPDAEQGKSNQHDQKLKIICTTGMVADVVRNVGGERVEVTTLMGPGVDPHLYKPSPGDASRLNAADVIVYSGLHLEGKMTELFERLAANKPTFPITERMDEKRLLGSDGGTHDPHVWFNVELWSSGAELVRDKLATILPAHAEEFRMHCEDYQQRLRELDRETRAAIATIPQEQRAIVTAHDAFRYFGQAYDLEVRGIQGISTESEAGVKQINELVNFLVKRKIKAVFVETSVSDQNVKSLLEGCAAQGHQLVIGGELFSDAMGDADTPTGTYEGMIRHNVATIVAALK